MLEDIQVLGKSKYSLIYLDLVLLNSKRKLKFPMIPVTQFASEVNRQPPDWRCMFYSYADCITALTQIHNRQSIISGFNQFFALKPSIIDTSQDPPRFASGYESINFIHNESSFPIFKELRHMVCLSRCSFDEMEQKLTDLSVTAMLCLHFKPSSSNGNGNPAHSVSVARDSEHGFYIRDSDYPTAAWGTRAINADAVGQTATDAVRQLIVQYNQVCNQNIALSHFGDCLVMSLNQQTTNPGP